MVETGMPNGQPVPPFFALCTDFQSEGRGMGANTWFSDPGKNLLASFYFEFPLPAARQFLFNQYFALATLEFIRRRIPQALIKWPNDIYVDRKKIAGILIEHVLRGDKLLHTIAGIGININQERFPEDIPHPTSLLLETGQKWNVTELLDEYWQTLFDNREHCAPAHAQELKEQYMKFLYLYNQHHSYIILGEKVEARIIDIDEYGRLVLETLTGKRIVCGFKEIAFL